MKDPAMTDKQIVLSIDNVITDLVNGMEVPEEEKVRVKSSFVRMIGLVARKYEADDNFKSILNDYCTLHEKQ